MLRFLTRAPELAILAALGVVSGCTVPQPALQGVAVLNPVCVALCWAVTENTRGGAGGAVSFEPMGGMP